MKTKYLIILVIILLSTCADNKTIYINGERRIFQPYGWTDYQELKNDSIIYKPNVGNIVLDVIFIETIFIPVWLTGWQFYEPIDLKTEYK